MKLREMGMRQLVQSNFDAQVLSAQTGHTSPVPRMQSRLLQTRTLDLLLLAGCSCLLTLLYHPVAEALPQAQSITAPLPGMEYVTTRMSDEHY